jgi:hypothetical protein
VGNSLAAAFDFIRCHESLREIEARSAKRLIRDQKSSHSNFFWNFVGNFREWDSE